MFDSTIEQQLAEQCPLFTKDEQLLFEHSHDYSEDLSYLPQMVFFPNSVEQISGLLKLCNQNSISVYPQGARTGLSGGCIPVRGGIVISTKNLNKIIAVDTENFLAIVEPGVVNYDFKMHVEKFGLYYPPDPASYGTCTLGGNIAHSSGGPRAVKYGTTKDYILNLEVVLPSGEVIWTGSNTVKNSTGFNLTQLMIGSEGMLAIVTKIAVKLISKPKLNELVLCAFENAHHAAKCVNDILTAGVLPSALELMDKNGVTISSSATKINFPSVEKTRYYLLIEFDDNDFDSLQFQVEKTYPIYEQNNALDMWIASSSQIKEDWWKIRRGIGEHVKQKSIYKEEDTVVPRAHLPALLELVEEIEKRSGAEIVCYGHAGDGNLHINILKNQLDDRVWNETLPIYIKELFTAVYKMGGTISGEHGIGLVQKQYLPIVFSDAHFELFRGIKKSFDPNGILNSGKWLD